MTGLQFETKSNSSFENFHDGKFSNALNKFNFRGIIEADVFRFLLLQLQFWLLAHVLRAIRARAHTRSHVENLLSHFVLVIADKGVMVKRVDVKSIFHKPRLLERAIEAATCEAAGFSR